MPDGYGKNRLQEIARRRMQNFKQPGARTANTFRPTPPKGNFSKGRNDSRLRNDTNLGDGLGSGPIMGAKPPGPRNSYAKKPGGRGPTMGQIR
jgi:hypothetical protein